MLDCKLFCNLNLWLQGAQLEQVTNFFLKVLMLDNNITKTFLFKPSYCLPNKFFPELEK